MLTLTINGTTRSLAAWGITSAKLTLANQNSDSLEFTCRRNALGAPAFRYGATIALQDSGSCVFSGLILTNPAFGNDVTEGFTYRAAGAWWYLEGKPFTQNRWGYDANGFLQKAPASEVVLFGTSFTAKKTIDDMLSEIAMASGGISISGGGFTASPPLEEAMDISCAEALRRVLRWIPDVCAGWDYRGTPTLCLYRRASAPSLVLDLLDTQVLEWSMSPREDIQVDGVVFNYKTIATIDGKQVSSYKTETIGDPSSYRAIHHTFELAYNSATGASEPIPAFLTQDYYTAVSSLQWEGRVSFRPRALTCNIRPGYTLNLTGGRPALATMQALIQSVSYDLVTGVVEVACGPTALIGPSDLQSLLDGGKSTGVSTTTIDTADASAPIITGYVPGASGSSTGGTGTTVTTRPATYDDRIGLTSIFPASAQVICSAKHRAATATLIGFGPINGVEATPPKRWLTRSQSGNTQTTLIDPVSPQIATDTWSGSERYDASTGAYTNGLKHVSYGPGYTGWSGWATTTQDPMTSEVLPAGYTAATRVDTETTATYTWNPAIPLNLILTGVASVSGSRAVTISDEDTEETAWARAVPPSDWESMAWAGVSASGLQPAAMAYWKNRTTGLSVDRQDAKLRVQCKGFFGLWGYTITCSVYRRANGSGASYSLHSTISVPLSTDTAGGAETVIEVPNERGYDTYITAPAISK